MKVALILTLLFIYSTAKVEGQHHDEAFNEDPHSDHHHHPFDEHEETVKNVSHLFPKTCPPNYFSCKDGKNCLSPKWQCDGHYDCEDYSDEFNCTHQDQNLHLAPHELDNHHSQVQVIDESPKLRLLLASKQDHHVVEPRVEHHQQQQQEEEQLKEHESVGNPFGHLEVHSQLEHFSVIPKQLTGQQQHKSLDAHEAREFQARLESEPEPRVDPQDRTVWLIVLLLLLSVTGLITLVSLLILYRQGHLPRQVKQLSVSFIPSHDKDGAMLLLDNDD